VQANSKVCTRHNLGVLISMKPNLTNVDVFIDRIPLSENLIVLSFQRPTTRHHNLNLAGSLRVFVQDV
jgi:hypothetical protein